MNNQYNLDQLSVSRIIIYYIHPNMQEDNDQDESQWKIGVNQPFQGHKQKFAAIPKSQRSEYTKQVLKKQQIQTLPPYNYSVPFPFESTFKYKQYDLNYYSLENTPTPKAILIIIHGLNGNGSVFGYLASKVAQKNKELNVYSFDQMNFGKSNGDLRGLIMSMDDSINQLQTFVSFITDKLKQKPKIFLSGMSYGGTVAFKATLKLPQKYAGVLFLAPALKDIDEHLYYSKQAIIYLGWLLPRLKIKQLTPPGLNTKYNITAQLKADPLIFTDNLIPGAVRAVMNGIAEVSRLYKQFKAPFLCIASGVEKKADPFSPLDFEEQSPSPDKKVVYAENMWHSVVYEEEIVGVSWHCAEWLKQRI